MEHLKNYSLILFVFSLGISCGFKSSDDKVFIQDSSIVQSKDTAQVNAIVKDTIKNQSYHKNLEIITYAKTLIGVPYKYGSSNKEIGFDCSGFITAVYQHFQIPVPISSVGFTNYGTTIPIAECKPGDLILFTGIDPTKRIVGHMGIVVQTQDTIKFIHSTSGKAYGVTITPLNSRYRARFEKIVRINNQ